MEWSICLAIFIYFTKEMGCKALYYSPQNRLFFHHAFWPFIYFTYFPHKNIKNKTKKLQPPPTPIFLWWPPKYEGIGQLLSGYTDYLVLARVSSVVCKHIHRVYVSLSLDT